MPLVIAQSGAYAAPQILCDQCGEQIQAAADGNYQWSHSPAFLEGHEPAPVFFTHKRCCRAFEAAHGEHDWGWCPLECLSFYLTQNLGSTWESAQAQGLLMAGRAR
jgi:hypothetical protein